LRGTRFRLNNLRKSGRSLDSSKRRAARAELADNCDISNEPLDRIEFGDGIMSEINARDIHSVLIDRLQPIDQTILVALEEGSASREVAKRLQLSHESVRRHRLKIAAEALKLGIVPLIPSPVHHRHRL
jgi:DNA-binding NarL/FixJ family response regulator